VALVKEKVIAFGKTLKEVEQKAKRERVHKLHHVSCPTDQRYFYPSGCMIFCYVPLEVGYGTYYRPLLFAEIFHPEDRTKKQKLLCLVDSGAGASLINDEYADALGIDLKAGREVPVMGIEANPVTAYGHMLTIKLDEELPEFSTLCYFVLNLSTSVLLGEEGIFDHFKIEFEKYKNIFAIIPTEEKNNSQHIAKQILHALVLQNLLSFFRMEIYKCFDTTLVAPEKRRESRTGGSYSSKRIG